MWEANKGGIRLNHATMASFPLDSHPELLTSDLVSMVEQCKGGLVCLRTSLKGAKTLYICPLWIWESIKGKGGLHSALEVTVQGQSRVKTGQSLVQSLVQKNVSFGCTYGKEVVNFFQPNFTGKMLRAI